MSWMQTYTGKRFDLANLDPGMVDIEDIAHALSRICRFTGHVSEHYSVAEHCVWVSYMVPQEDALAGLLHDAHEAYVGDMGAPLKALMPEYKEFEKAVEELVLGRFGVAFPLPESVHVADMRMVLTEGRDLLPGGILHDWSLPFEPYSDFILTAWDAEFSKDTFLRRFGELTRG